MSSFIEAFASLLKSMDRLRYAEESPIAPKTRARYVIRYRRSSMLMREFGAIVSLLVPYAFNPKIRASISSNFCIQECMVNPRADHTSMLPQVFARYHLPNISVRTFSSSGIVTEASSLSLSQYLVLGLGIAYFGK